MRAILQQEISPEGLKRKKLYSEYRRCSSCGRRFEVKHKLRQYCDECRP